MDVLQYIFMKNIILRPCHLLLYQKIFEGQFIQISEADTATDILLGNIYRPPGNLLSNYKSFTQEIPLTLNTFLNRNYEIIIGGDMNID